MFKLAVVIGGIVVLALQAENSRRLRRIARNVIDNKQKLKQIMATEQELLALLQEANTATNEIAEDIQTLLARETNISDATMAEVQGLVDRLKGVASTYTPPTTEQPTEPTPEA